MHEIFRTLAIHQGRFYQGYLQTPGARLGAESLDILIDALGYDALWLTKFPLLWAPTFGVYDLDAFLKSWAKGDRTPGAIQAAADAVGQFRPQVDADTLRFVLKLTPADLETRVEIFFGGRAMNKPLWHYLLGWFEHGATLRGKLTGPSLFETAFS